MTRRKAATAMSNQDLSEVSLAIGELRAGQAFQKEALLAIQGDVKTIVNALPNLPPSPQCKAEHVILHSKIDETEKKVTTLTTKISALIIGGATAVKFFLNQKLGIDI